MSADSASPRNYRDLCIEQLADDLSEAIESRDSYRLLALMAIAEMARLAKENKSLLRRLSTLLADSRHDRMAA